VTAVVGTVAVLTHRPQARWRAYCLPPAGLGAEFYLPWCAVLPQDVELCAVQLPGRGPLVDQPCATDTRALTTSLADLVTAQADPRPFALFGHSLGALLAFTTACRLQRAHRRPPALLAVSGFPPPHLGAYPAMVGELLAAGHLGAAELLGFRADALGDPARLATAYLPVVGDLLLLLQHRHRDEPPLDCDLAVYGGQDDPAATPAQLAAWNDLANTPTTPRLFPGGHTFPVTHAEAVTARLHQDLRTAVGVHVS
jgi:surfactin synthase thioesterase subunit